MTISWNWLKEYINCPVTLEEVTEWLTRIGLEVEGVHPFERIPGNLAGVVVGHVLTCDKHPDADKLSVTTVDIGAEEVLNIVCGAPNVRQGQKVLVATVGTSLTFSNGETITLKKTKIRGAASEGMICAEDELGLGTDHSGIMVLREDAIPGTKAADYLQLTSDTVIEIGLTPNRSDATSHIGVARDVVAALSFHLYPEARVLTPPATPKAPTAKPLLSIPVSIEEKEACPRYSGLTITGITVGPSPQWVQDRLSAIGVRPINNVVDATNYVLHEMGQPLHAFDADKIHGGIVVKTLPTDTPFTALDDKEYKLRNRDLMICDANGHPLCIGGVFGGAGSGVTETTRSIFLESAYFHPKWIRATSMHHLLRTDAATVFEKGANPNQTVEALYRAAAFICEWSGGQIASELVDHYPEPVLEQTIEVRYDKVRQVIGAPLEDSTIYKILDLLQMKPSTSAASSGVVLVRIPTDKSDVVREIDVIEEVLRIYGLDTVPAPEQFRSAAVLGEQPDRSKLRRLVSEQLVGQGFCETMAMSLTQSHYINSFYPLPEESLVFINNTSNAQLDLMRPVMIFSALEMVTHNQNRQRQDLRLFEFGKVYRMDGEGTPRESWRLTLTMTGRRTAESWMNTDSGNVDLFDLKAQVELVLLRLGLNGYQVSAAEDPLYRYGLKFHRGPKVFAELGQVSPRLSKGLEARNEVYYAELHWDNIVDQSAKSKLQYQDPGKYPSVRRDLAVVIPKSVTYDSIAALARKYGKQLLKEVNLFDVFEDESKLGEGKRSYGISLIFEDTTRTLQDKEIESIVSQLIDGCTKQLGAEIRK